ncbi:MAG: DNRLRE domain-containing protein [Dehalococcoidia bacterium]|nr:DNRLRE domain-containing protein [Dehalococcoidia bacterium]
MDKKRIKVRAGLKPAPTARRILIAACLAAALAAPLLQPLPARAGMNVAVTRTLSASADSWLEEGSQNTNYGSSTTMSVWSAGGGTKNARAIVWFTLPAIPTGSTVTTATLSLYASAVPASTRTYDVHRITATWAEGTVTWRLQPAFNSTATTSLTTPGTAGWMNFTVTSDVSAFITGSATNYGWVIKDQTEGSGTQYRTDYYTEENASANKPKLTVTYTAPWDSYTTSGRTVVGDTYTTLGDSAWMKGTTFSTSTTYNISYYDGDVSGGFMVFPQDNVTAAGGTLNSDYLLDSGNAVAGLWHAVVQPNTGFSVFPNNYDTIIAAPDTYGLLANDSFNVAASAIPELPTVFSALAAVLFSAGIYWWMRRRVYRVC